MSKKLISAVLTATTFAWAVGAAFIPVAANAQTTSSLQAQIAALLAQIQQLQGQLNTQSGTSGTTTTSYSFTKDLTLGSRGADVTALQNMLISAGDLSASATGYFGALTKAALIKYQAAKGISPTSGYFGPKSRAFVNSVAVSTGTTTGTTTTTTGTTVTTTVTAPATGLAVSLASTNPVAGSLISSATAGAARVPVLAVSFTAGNSSAATVTSVAFHKAGVLSDSSIAGAYLTQSGKVLYQYNSLNQGVLTFSGMSLNVPAGQTVTLVLAIDMSSALSAGNTVGFSLNGADQVTSYDASNNLITETGAFPLNGNTFTVTSVSNPALATLTVTSSSIGTTVTAGTQGNLVGAWNFTGANSKLWLKGLNFRVIGSASKGDIRNVKLMVNGKQVGTTLPTVGQDGNAYFDTSATPGVLNTGSNNVQLFADVMGSPSFNFQFEILNSYDVLAVDSQYNIPVSAGSNTGTQVSIAQGTITVTQDSATPTGNVAKGQSGVTLAKFDVYAAGEAVKIKYIDFTIALAGGTGAFNTAAGSTQLKNISLVDDAGGQVGTTISTPPSTNTCTVPNATATYATSSATAATFTDCFGTSASPINYIVPANTTRVLSLKADVQSGATFGTATAALTQETGSNLQGLTSSASANSSGATGSALTLASASLTTSVNNALGNATISAGVTSQRVSSYSFTASSAEGVTISNMSVQSNGVYFQNLKIMVAGAQFGTTWGSLASGTAYSFSGTPFTVPAGATVNVDVYADTLSTGTGSVTPATILTAYSGTGLVSQTAVSMTGTLSGQNVTFGGTPTVSVTTDSSQAPAGQLVMGSTGNSLATFRFTETSNVENLRITDLKVTAITSSTKAAFSNVGLWNGSTLVGTAGAASSTTGGAIGSYFYSFHFGTPVIVPQANSLSLVLKGDVATYASAGAVDNSTSSFSIVASSTDVTALGNTSNKAVTATVSSANGNLMTVMRSNLVVSAAALGGSAHSKTNPDALGTVTVTANTAGPVALRMLALTFSGSALTYGSGTFIGNVSPATSSITMASGTLSAASTTWSVIIDGVTLTTASTYSSSSDLTTVANDLAGVIKNAYTGTGTSTTLYNLTVATSSAAGVQKITLTNSNLATAHTTAAGTTSGGGNTTGGGETIANAAFGAATGAFGGNVMLYDYQGNNVLTSEATSTTQWTSSAGSTSTVYWTFLGTAGTNTLNATGTGFTFSGSTTFTLKVNDSSNLVPATGVAGAVESLGVNLQNATDLTYWDALDSNASAITTLPVTAVPLTINTVTFPAGQ